MFGNYNLPVRALNFYFLSVHFSIDLSRVDRVGCPILATNVQHAAALFPSFLGFEGWNVHAAAIKKNNYSVTRTQ